MSFDSFSPRLVIDHFYMGVLITLVYVLTSPLLIAAGYPGFAALLLVEIAVLAPIVLIHLYVVANRVGDGTSLDRVILYREPINARSFFMWSVLGFLAIFAVYIPLYPVGLAIRESFFSWLPEWYFNPGYGAQDLALLANIFLVGILIDGFIGPIAEELFFRGYLLPRMEFLQGWAPIVNGTLFGLYHFWQPHNVLALVAVGCILSYIVWKTRNVYVGIVVHCAINITGAVGGYLAVTRGVELAR